MTTRSQTGRPGGGPRAGRRPRRRQGQALLIVGLSAVLLCLFVGLGVDVAYLLGEQAKLQSAVDSAALSAALTLYSSDQGLAKIRAAQVMEASGVPSNTLAGLAVDFPAIQSQVHVAATQTVPTNFMRLIPAWSQVNVFAQATADTSSYAEINIKPYGKPGVVNELNISVWGTDSVRSHGDAYSPVYLPDFSRNPFHDQQPYGYLYRIDVPASYLAAHSRLVVQIFDPDSYNRPDSPPSSCNPCSNPWDFSAYCASAGPDCTTGGAREDTGLRLKAYANGRPAFWRTDEIREPYKLAGQGGYHDEWATTTTYTLWHFSPQNTTAFGDPMTLTDSSPAGPIASYTVGLDGHTDLRWYQPPGFNIDLAPYERESNGGVYFYLYVQGTAGSSENNFDLRVGPPAADISTNLACTDISGSPYASDCYVNKQYYNNVTDWQDGGALIFAKRALPLNLDTGDHFAMQFVQLSNKTAGQTLSVRHFDQDCTGGCGPAHTMDYQMLRCGADPGLDSSWEHVASGYVGPDDAWYCPGCADPEAIPIPAEGTAQYNDFFGSNGECSTTWLRLASDPSYSQDTTVWEMPFLRPRLIK